MAQFKIHGPNTLSGEIPVYGAKNAAMKMIAACVLIQDQVVLENVPDILDIENIVKILSQNGAKILRQNQTLKIDTSGLKDILPDPTLVKKMRGAIVLVGPYLSRFGHITIPQPGGCAIGARPIDTHLKAFESIGTEIVCEKENYSFTLEQNQGGQVDLIEASVTATENIIMSQVIGSAKTVIKNAATEPQIIDLANFLNLAGAKISGAGTREIVIEGVQKLNGLKFKVMPDPFEAATFVCMAIVTKSEIKITNCRPDQMYPFLDVIRKMGAIIEEGKDYLLVKKTPPLKPIEIKTDIHPGFSTDMQAPLGLVMTQAQGESQITEKLFENRLNYLKQLVEMGARAEILNAHEAKIFGPCKLRGAHIESLDLRAGATLVLAGLIAEGETIIENAEIIDRGYEKIEKRLQQIGAKIERIS